MRVLSVSPYWPPAGGGLERYARETATRLAARGHEVRALAFAKDGAPAALDDAGVEVDLLRPSLRLSNTPLSTELRARIAHEIGRWRPDLVLAHGPVPFPLEMAALACRRADVAFVPVVHAGALEGRGMLLGAAAALDRATFFELACRRADRIVAVSEFVRDGLLRRHAAKTRVVPPGVDLARFRPGPPADASRVLFVGPVDSAYEWKGFRVLWHAARLAQVELLVAGDGDRRAWYEARAAADGVRARFVGRVSDVRLVSLYHEAGAVALPSLSDAESFGMVLAEGNACARPAVGSRAGGIPCFVRDGETGFLAATGDAGSLAQALRRLADDAILARRMGENGRRLVAQRHDWERLVDELEGVLHEAVDGRARVLAPA